MQKVSITDPLTMRAIKDDPRFQSEELYKGEANGHKFKAGDVVILDGLQNFSEYNGDQVEITSIRADGPNGKAYYIKGRVNEVMNWVYESKIQAQATPSPVKSIQFFRDGERQVTASLAVEKVKPIATSPRDFQLADCIQKAGELAESLNTLLPLVNYNRNVLDMSEETIGIMRRLQAMQSK